jgi:hypothetical protein
MILKRPWSHGSVEASLEGRFWCHTQLDGTEHLSDPRARRADSRKPVSGREIVGVVPSGGESHEVAGQMEFEVLRGQHERSVPAEAADEHSQLEQDVVPHG